MNQETWTAVDAYLCDGLVKTDPALDNTLRTSEAAGLPHLYVTPTQGMLLQILARMQGARKILELGTLGGYSTIWLARALPEGGKLITIESSPKHAGIAKNNLAVAGLSHLVEIRIGKAIEIMPALSQEGLAPFDFIFIDADKPGCPDYLAWSLKLSRPGTVIVADNVVRKGKLADPSSTDPNVIGVRRLIDLMAEEPRLSATVIQTVGSKGHDGFALAIVTS